MPVFFCPVERCSLGDKRPTASSVSSTNALTIFSKFRTKFLFYTLNRSFYFISFVLYNWASFCLIVDERKYSFDVRLNQITLVQNVKSAEKLKHQFAKAKRSRIDGLFMYKCTKSLTWDSERPVCKYISYLFKALRSLSMIRF